MPTPRTTRKEHQCQLDVRGGSPDREDASREGCQGDSTRGSLNPSEGRDDVDDKGKSDHCEGPKLERSEALRRARAGEARRAHLRKGTAKRLFGNAKTVVASIFIATCAFVGAATQMLPNHHMNRPDLLEVFAGHAEVSTRFASWGWRTSEPLDIMYDTDLRDEHTRQWLLSWIETQRPRLVLVAYPCKLWSVLTNIQYTTGQEKRRLQKLRKQEMPFLELCEAIFELQHVVTTSDNVFTLSDCEAPCWGRP